MTAVPDSASPTHSPILLVGNSINRLARGKSWDHVLADLRLAARSPHCVRGAHKPYPIYFEELHCRALKAGVSESVFLTQVAQQFGQLATTPYHQRLMRLETDHILTTNYDYTLEDAVGARPASIDLADRWEINEARFSLFRRNQAGGRWVWHIHGEALTPGSIMLGQDHYVNQAGRLREYWSAGVTYAAKGRLHTALRKNAECFETAKSPYAWLDLFVRNPVHICGLTFDFSETVLWFALTRRRLYNQYRRRHKSSPGRIESSDMQHVHYHYFDHPENSGLNRTLVDVFESMGVHCVPHRVVRNDYEKAWQKLLAHLEGELGTRAARDARRRA